MCRKEVENIITEIFIKQGIAIDIDFNHELEQFGFNSWCYIELVVELEKFYHITINDEDLDFTKFKKVSDICKMLQSYNIN